VKRELNDIRFEFSVGRDSADGIASELVAAGAQIIVIIFFITHLHLRLCELTGLVDGRDLVVIAANLQKILDGLPITTSVTFGLVRIHVIGFKITVCDVNPFFAQSSGCVGNEVPDDRTLVGFAQLSIAE
jgi:serine/threonine-protein kinase OSR1/STK39